MGQALGLLGLPLKRYPGLGVLAELGTQDLDGDMGVGVPGLLLDQVTGPVDDVHPPPAQQFLQHESLIDHGA